MFIHLLTHLLPQTLSTTSAAEMSEHLLQQSVLVIYLRVQTLHILQHILLTAHRLLQPIPCFGIGPTQSLSPQVSILVNRRLSRRYPRIQIYLTALLEAVHLTVGRPEKLDITVWPYSLIEITVNVSKNTRRTSTFIFSIMLAIPTISKVNRHITVIPCDKSAQNFTLRRSWLCAQVYTARMPINTYCASLNKIGHVGFYSGLHLIPISVTPVGNLAYFPMVRSSASGKKRTVHTFVKLMTTTEIKHRTVWQDVTGLPDVMRRSEFLLGCIKDFFRFCCVFLRYFLSRNFSVISYCSLGIFSYLCSVSLADDSRFGRVI